MTQYLLDTNIVAFLFRNKYHVKERLKAVGVDNCHISIITYAELYYGCKVSGAFEQTYNDLEQFCEFVDIISINDVIPLYAEEKMRLRKQGLPIDDFDLLIGTTAVKYGMTLVTDNVKHLGRINNILLEDCIDRKEGY